MKKIFLILFCFITTANVFGQLDRRHEQCNSFELGKVKIGKMIEYCFPLLANTKSLGQEMNPRLLDSPNKSLYEDYRSPARMKVAVSSLGCLTKLLNSILKREDLMMIKDTGYFLINKIKKTQGYSIYSVMHLIEGVCDQCEIPSSQLVNLLVTANNKRVIDALLVGVYNGDDLVSKHRYFRAEKNQELVVKDFLATEVDARLKKTTFWKLNATGSFIPAK